MPRNRINYQVEAIYAGPAPATGFHFLDYNGNLNDDYASGDNNLNLIRPINRVVAFNYEIQINKTDIQTLGKQSNLARPFVSPPEVNLSIDYLQMGVINEVYLGFYTNYKTLETGNPEPIFPSNYNVCFISGFIDRKLNRAENELRWPYTYRDCRNIFAVLGNEGSDVNNSVSGVADKSGVVVMGFGNCYVTSYKTTASVGTIPKASVNYVCENITISNSGSGISTPAVNPFNYSGVNKKAIIPSNYQGTSLPALLPGDISIELSGIARRNSINAIYGTGAERFTGNLLGNSEVLSSTWGLTRATQTGNVATAPDGTLTADFLVEDSSTNNSHYCLQSMIYATGKSYVYSVYAKPSGRNFISLFTRNFQSGSIYAYYDIYSGKTGFASSGVTQSLIEPAGFGWYRCSMFFNQNLTGGFPSQHMLIMLGSGNANLDFCNYNGLSTSGALLWGWQLTEGNWDRTYVQTVGSTSGVKSIGYTNPQNFLIDWTGAKVQAYDITVNLPREPLRSLTARLPLDRQITFPVYANLGFSVVVGDMSSGSLIDLFNKQDEYNIAIKLANPRRFAVTGIGIRYDFLRAKLDSIRINHSLGENQTANFNFSVEIDPSDYSKGFFMSGLLNIEKPLNVISNLSQEDLSYLLQEDGSRLLLDSFSFFY